MTKAQNKITKILTRFNLLKMENAINKCYIFLILK